MSKILFLISLTINSFYDKDKGSKTNRTACAYSHFTNSLSSNAQILGALGITTAVGHYKPVLNIKRPTKIDFSTIKTTAKQLYEDFKSAPKWLKTIAIGLSAMSLVNRTFKKISIERKYNDRALLDETKKEKEKEIQKQNTMLNSAKKA